MPKLIVLILYQKNPMINPAEVVAAKDVEEEMAKAKPKPKPVVMLMAKDVDAEKIEKAKLAVMVKAIDADAEEMEMPTLMVKVKNQQALLLLKMMMLPSWKPQLQQSE